MNRLACLLLACAVALTAVLPAAAAEEENDFLLCVIENAFIEDVTEAGHACYISGTIYVPYSVLSTMYGVRAYYNERLQQLFVYSLDLRMTFDMANEQTYDTNGDFFPQLAVRRAGTIFIPIQLVCDRFGLYYSFTPAGRMVPAPTIRICADRPSTSDSVLYTRSAALTEEIYARYLALLNPVTPDDPTPDPEPEPLLTYLMLTGPLGEHSAAMLDELQTRDCPAAFFLPAAAPDGQPALLRRLYAGGFTVGLLLEGTEDDPVAVLREGNERLCAVLHTKTRLVSVAAGADMLTDEQREAIVAAGFRLWDANLDPGSGQTTADGLLRAARRQLSRARGTAVVLLRQDEAAAGALSGLCRVLEGSGYSLLRMNEWDRPINRADEVR